MKKLFLAAATLISTVSFSQVITITYNKTKAFNTLSNFTNSENFLKLYETQSIFDVDHPQCKKIIDLNKMEVLFYENGIYHSTLKIKSFDKNKNTYKIIVDDINTVVGGQLDVYLFVDLSKNLSLSYWYYDHCDMTFMFNQYNNKIKIEI